MTVASTTRRNDATGNGATKTYSYNFRILDDDELLVSVQDTAGVITALTKTTDYTVTGVGLYAGGTIVLVNAGQSWLDADGDLKSSYKLTIRRRLPLTQQTDLRNSGDFYPEDHETQFDRCIMIDLQQQDELDRSIKFPETDSPALSATLPASSLRASKWAAYDSLGQPIASSGSPPASVPVSVYGETLVAAGSAAAARAVLELPGGFTGAKGKGLRVNASETAYEHVGLLKRNVLINGDFNIWQAGTSFAGVSTNTYVADMAAFVASAQGVYTISRDTSIPTVAQAGRYLSYSLKVLTTTTAGAPAAGDLAQLRLDVEGYDYAPLYQQVQTLKFWVKSNKTGTYSAAFRNSGADRSYVSEFSISVADTWEEKTITISTAPTGGTWDFTNGRGISVTISLSAGSTYQTPTLNAWQTGDYRASTNQVNFPDTLNNYINIADVRLVAGYDASDIYIPSIEEQLRTCQRYYEKSYDTNAAPGTASSTGAHIVRPHIVLTDGNTPRLPTISFKTVKRASPTITSYSTATGASGKVRNLAYDGINNRDVSATGNDINESSFRLTLGDSLGASSVFGHVSAEVVYQFVADARL